ncbi:MAG: SulP family inorganic anion transporter [Bacteroidia bacterium]
MHDQFKWSHSWRQDVPAGLVVFLVALPLCLGIALASGAPLFSGIVAGIVGGLVVGAVSQSPLSVSGPAAGLTVIVLSAIDKLGAFETFLLSVVLAGVIQLALGFLKAGVIGYYFPSSVIKGMLAAIGLILILKQIPHALGYDADAMGDDEFLQIDGETTFSELINAWNFFQPGAILISAIALAIIIFWEKLKGIPALKLVPGALVAVVVGTLINEGLLLWYPSWALIDPSHLVQLPISTGVGDFFGSLQHPDWSAFGNKQVYITALTMAIVASLETLLSVEAADKLDPYKRNTPTNRELKAQGLGNIVSGLLGGLPLTAVIVRSSANVQAGGLTRLSTIVHGSLLLLSVLLFPRLLNHIPLACLAAVLLVVGYKLTKISLFKEMFRRGWDQFLPFVVTIVAILFSDLLIGIGWGMAISFLYILLNNYKTPYFFHREDHHEGERIHLQLSEDVSFLNKASLLMTLHHLPEGSKVLIDGSRSRSIDWDIIEIIEEFRETAKSKDISLEIKGIPPDPGEAARHPVVWSETVPQARSRKPPGGK